MEFCETILDHQGNSRACEYCVKYFKNKNLNLVQIIMPIIQIMPLIVNLNKKITNHPIPLILKAYQAKVFV